MKTNSHKITISKLVIAIFILSVYTACSQESDTGDQQLAESTTATSEESLPEGFPDTVPVFSPHDIATISKSEIAGQTRFTIGFMTTGNKDEIVAYYKKELSTNGWSINKDVSSDGRWSAKNEEMIIVVNVVKAGNGAVFTITAPKEQTEE